MEKFISDLKNTAKSAAAKTGELIEIGKLKIACQETKNKINDAYKELGKAVYSAQREEEDAENLMVELIENIDSLFEKLAQQEEELALLKKQKKCSSCGTMCDDDSAFCSKCGFEFK